jgi:ArsR family transcriptional regulator
MRLLEIYRCLCDETRLRILNLLAQGPLCVCHFQSVLACSQVAVSKHLAYLRARGLVVARRHGQWMIYQLPATPPAELETQLRCLQDCVQTYPVFREDVRRLKQLRRESKCEWIPDTISADNGKRPSPCCVHD